MHWKVGRFEVHMGRNVAPGWGWWKSGGAMLVIATGSRIAVVSPAGKQILGGRGGERLKFGTAGAAIGADPAMATVGKLDGAEDAGRKGPG